MSVIEGVDDATSATVSDLSSTVLDVERRPIRELVDDRLLDELLARSRDEAGGLRLTGEGSMLGELVKAVGTRRPALVGLCAVSYVGDPRDACLYERQDVTGDRSAGGVDDLTNPEVSA